MTAWSMYKAQDRRDTDNLMSRFKGDKADDGTDTDNDGNTNDTMRMMNSQKFYPRLIPEAHCPFSVPESVPK